MQRVYHSSAMLLGDKSSGIFFFTAFCIIGGKLCKNTFRNAQLANMGLELPHQTSVEAFWTWRHAISCL